MGLRASDTSEVVMEDCRIPADQLLGERGAGFVDAMKILDGGRLSIGALALGMARGAYEAALRYSREREQFGRSIADFQAIQFMLADMATKIDAARSLIYRAAWMKDNGQNVTKESAMAKLFASEIGVEVADKALQIFGGYGYVKDFPVGEVLPRHEALHDRRRDERDPANRDRARDAQTTPEATPTCNG